MLVLDNPFHGEFNSADASTPADEPAARFSLFNRDKTAITLAAGDRVVITDIVIVVGSAITVYVFDGANTTVAAGERISVGSFPANGGVKDGATTPHYCAAGTYPKLKTSGAGQVDAIIRGHIVSG